NVVVSFMNRSFVQGARLCAGLSLVEMRLLVRSTLLRGRRLSGARFAAEENRIEPVDVRALLAIRADEWAHLDQADACGVATRPLDRLAINPERLGPGVQPRPECPLCVHPHDDGNKQGRLR